jgi:N-acyl homoserine lactone hydrolase
MCQSIPDTISSDDDLNHQIQRWRVTRMKKMIFILTLIFSIFLSGSAFAAEKSDYSIKLLEYGGIKDYPNSGLVYGAHNQGTTYLPFFYILIQN